MPNGEELTDLLRCAIQIIGRGAIPLERVQEIVGAGAKQIRAFNLADGSLALNDIARKAKIDQGNLSRTVDRWVNAGASFWIGRGAQKRLTHIYPLPTPATKRKSRRR